MLFIQLSSNRYGLWLSNELLFRAEEAAKLLPVKVQGLKKLPYATSIFFVILTQAKNEAKSPNQSKAIFEYLWVGKV